MRNDNKKNIVRNSEFGIRSKGKNNSAIHNPHSEFKKVYIIGIGPGSLDYLIPAAKKEIEKAECLIGGSRILSLFDYPDKKKVCLDGCYRDAISYIQKNKEKEKIAVLVSGDPGLYSFLGQVSSVLGKEEYEVIPGISSLQLAFAKSGESWHDAKIISLHGREVGNLAEDIKKSNKVFLFTDKKFPPSEIADYLLNNGIENRKVLVFEELSYPGENILETNLESLMRNAECGMRNEEKEETEMRSAECGVRNEEENKLERGKLCVMIILKR